MHKFRTETPLMLPALFIAFALGSEPVKAVTVASKKAAENAPAAVLEAAPLRGILGQVAVRGEAAVWRFVALGAAYEQFAAASQRAAFKDEHAAISAELVAYPMGTKDYPVFVAAGVRHESATIGREATRDTGSWARTTADERNDRWTSHETYWSATQAFGYRLMRLGLLTAALRFQRDEVLSESAQVTRDDVRSFSPDLSTAGRPTVVTSLVLHAGVYLP